MRSKVEAEARSSSMRSSVPNGYLTPWHEPRLELDSIEKSCYNDTMSEKTLKPVALLDLDGSVAAFDEALQKGLDAIRGPNDPPYTEEAREEPYMTARRRLIKSQPGFWENLPKIKLGFDVVDALVRLDFAVTVLTKAPIKIESAWTEKVRWVKRNLPEDFEVTLTQDKSKVYGKVLVDDWVPYFLPWLEVRPRGLVVAVAQPWNKDVDHPRVVRYDGTNYAEVVERLKASRDRE